ncbi:methyl-accepting chemotaxis protein [Clostridium sp. P21]|uniref:Methyl-accepting chemotaxis protein n=1 Tax=Clostridium muellerianum TaxID=2716538 RepID=A0A7Y0EEB1_9CLOT|nr:methyl-accepting chemotaxis protein [Clostridium muellerianum]NMM61895.1 methyl-accepting chemotaxis protein [Clostridium muellerianum]
MINKIHENKLMESFYNMMPYFKYYFGTELIFTISNTKKFLLVENSENLTTNFKAGDEIPKNSAADVCLKKKKVIHITVPKEEFGIPIETIGIPVFVNNNIEGTVVVGISTDRTKKREKITNLANTLSESLTQMSSNAVEMSFAFQQINQTNESIGEFIKKTKESSKKTDEVLTFIKDIAKHTNLLGLNAAIESARAGEYGKGFSVVSSEIRKLSNSTKQSIDEINIILNNIQNSINEIYDKFKCSNSLLEDQTAGLQEGTATIEGLTSKAAILNEFASGM